MRFLLFRVKLLSKKIFAEDRATELNVNADFLENLVGLDIPRKSKLRILEESA